MDNCRKRELPSVCWMIPKLPTGGKEAGPVKLGKNRTLLLGASKSGWLKRLNASAIEPQAKTIADLEGLADGHVEPHLEWRPEDVPSE